MPFHEDSFGLCKYSSSPRICDEGIRELCFLLYLNVEEPTDTPSEKWLGRQKAKVAALPELHLGIHRQKKLSATGLQMAWSVFRNGKAHYLPPPALLCDAHHGLNPWVVRDIFNRITRETTVHVESIRHFPGTLTVALTPQIVKHVARMNTVAGLYADPDFLCEKYDVFGAAGGHPARGWHPEFGFRRVENQCEACILAAVGRTWKLLAAIRANVFSRTVKDREPDDLVRIIKHWAKTFRKPTRAKILADSDSLVDVLRNVRGESHRLLREMQRAAQDAAVASLAGSHVAAEAGMEAASVPGPIPGPDPIFGLGLTPNSAPVSGTTAAEGPTKPTPRTERHWSHHISARAARYDGAPPVSGRRMAARPSSVRDPEAEKKNEKKRKKAREEEEERELECERQAAERLRVQVGNVAREAEMKQARERARKRHERRQREQGIMDPDEQRRREHMFKSCPPITQDPTAEDDNDDDGDDDGDDCGGYDDGTTCMSVVGEFYTTESDTSAKNIFDHCLHPAIKQGMEDEARTGRNRLSTATAPSAVPRPLQIIKNPHRGTAVTDALDEKTRAEYQAKLSLFDEPKQDVLADDDPDWDRKSAYTDVSFMTMRRVPRFPRGAAAAGPSRSHKKARGGMRALSEEGDASLPALPEEEEETRGWSRPVRPLLARPVSSVYTTVTAGQPCSDDEYLGDVENVFPPTRFGQGRSDMEYRTSIYKPRPSEYRD